MSINFSQIFCPRYCIALHCIAIIKNANPIWTPYNSLLWLSSLLLSFCSISSCCCKRASLLSSFRLEILLQVTVFSCSLRLSQLAILRVEPSVFKIIGPNCSKETVSPSFMVGRSLSGSGGGSCGISLFPAVAKASDDDMMKIAIQE